MCSCSPNVSPRQASRLGSTLSSPRGLRGRRCQARGELLRRSDLTAAELRQNVTSPKGTTAAALEVLMGKDGFADLLKRAVKAAAKRSRELSS